jgi:hypothetical protein
MNNIGDAGLLHLSKATWTQVKTLSLSHIWTRGGDWMRVGGYSYLIRGNWGHLKNLTIGIYTKMQAGPI